MFPNITAPVIWEANFSLSVQTATMVDKPCWVLIKIKMINKGNLHSPTVFHNIGSSSKNLAGKLSSVIMEMGFLVHIFAKQNGNFPWHLCPQGIKLLRAVIVSLFHKVGTFCDGQILFLYMLVCNSWTQHLLCILMSTDLLSVPEHRWAWVCWAPWRTWQHGEEVSWGRAASRQTHRFRAIKVIVSTYGLSWIWVLSWSPLWSPYILLQSADNWVWTWCLYASVDQE